MTTADVTGALEVYLQYPMADGEAVLLLPDEQVCLELGPLSDAEDRPEQVAELVGTLRTGTALLAVARTASRPRPADLLLWADLCGALRGVHLLPLEVLPASR